MGEYIPVVDEKGKIREFVNLGADFVYYSDGASEKIFFWDLDKGVLINDLIKDSKIILPDADIIVIDKLLDKTKNIIAYTFSTLDDIVKIIAKNLREKLKGKKVLHSFSGGKDSIASLYLLLKLQSEISFKLDAVYVHVPYLESLDTHRFLDDVEKRLGIEIKRLEADRKIMLYSFKKYGMPFRGFRWCTYLKVKAIRKVKKEGRYDYEVKGDRSGESYKRFKTLLEYAKQRMFISGKQFKPIFFMTLLDVVRINRELDLVHPHYLKGCPRIACEFCPYKNLFEFSVTDKNVEDIGFIENMIKETYKRGYDIPFEDYINRHMWRFHPNLAKSFYSLSKILRDENLETISIQKVVNDFSSIWINPLPKLKVINFDKIFEELMNLSKIEKFGVFEL